MQRRQQPAIIIFVTRLALKSVHSRGSCDRSVEVSSSQATKPPRHETLSGVGECDACNRSRAVTADEPKDDYVDGIYVSSLSILQINAEINLGSILHASMTGAMKCASVRRDYPAFSHFARLHVSLRSQAHQLPAQCLMYPMNCLYSALRVCRNPVGKSKLSRAPK